MAICLVCGDENSKGCICSTCAGKTDLETLAKQMIAYDLQNGDNPVWNNIIENQLNKKSFRWLVFAVTSDLPAPKKDYLRVCAAASIYDNKCGVVKNSRPWLYEITGLDNFVKRKCAGGETGIMPSEKDSLLDSENLSGDEQSYAAGLDLDALYKDYRYEEAELVLNYLKLFPELPFCPSVNMADYYIKTRRYDEAEKIIDKLRSQISCTDNNIEKSTVEKLEEDKEKYLKKKLQGKREYYPKPDENKDDMLTKYEDFISSIGVDIPDYYSFKKMIPDPIPRDQYPSPKEIRDTDFDSFVAFSLGITGEDVNKDCIYEIDAVKVVSGVISGERYHTYVKPYKKGLEKVAESAGIPSDILKDSPQMWEMFNLFMDYAGDLVLVGYDVMRIGSKFLARAGRYANRIVNNLYFDLKRGALNASGEDRVPVSADDVAEMYLTSRNDESKDKEISMEDMFAEWEE